MLSKPNTNHRSKALECAALYALARPAAAALPTASLLLRRALVASEPPAVKSAAAKGLSDLFLSLGPHAIESVLAAAPAGAEEGGEGAGEGGEEEEARWRAGDGRGVIGLLAAAARGVLNANERAAGGKGGRCGWSAAVLRLQRLGFCNCVHAEHGIETQCAEPRSLALQAGAER